MSICVRKGHLVSAAEVQWMCQPLCFTLTFHNREDNKGTAARSNHAETDTHCKLTLSFLFSLSYSQLEGDLVGVEMSLT